MFRIRAALTSFQSWFEPGYWRYGFSLTKAASALLQAFGTLWLVTSIATFFSTVAGDWIRARWFVFAIAGAAWALWANRPKHSVVCKLDGRDVRIEIRVGDLFEMPGALIIGSNRTFDTDTASGLINTRSVQGQFTEKYYDSVSHFDSDLERALSGVEGEVDATKRGKTTVFPVGTTVMVRPKGRTTYLVAIATMNQHGNAHGSFDDVKNCLPGLWEFVASRGDMQPLTMPVLGSGFSRLPETREEIIREVVKSFVAACASHRPCEALTIAIPFKDFYQNSVDLSELERFTQHVCKYSGYRVGNGGGTGTPVTWES